MSTAEFSPPPEGQENEISNRWKESLIVDIYRAGEGGLLTFVDLVAHYQEVETVAMEGTADSREQIGDFYNNDILIYALTSGCASYFLLTLDRYFKDPSIIRLANEDREIGRFLAFSLAGMDPDSDPKEPNLSVLRGFRKTGIVGADFNEQEVVRLMEDCSIFSIGRALCMNNCSDFNIPGTGENLSRFPAYRERLKIFNLRKLQVMIEAMDSAMETTGTSIAEMDNLSRKYLETWAYPHNQLPVFSRVRELGESALKLSLIN